MAEPSAYAVTLRLDPETTQMIVDARKALLQQEDLSHLTAPPHILLKGPFRACVPCGALIQRLELGMLDFDPVSLHLGDLRWLNGTQLHWDATRNADGEQNFELMHLKTQLWMVSSSLVSIHCEFSPSEPFSFRTINPWQPGISLVRRRTPPTEEYLLPLQPREARGQVLELFRMQMQGSWVISWQHVASFAGRHAAQVRT
ncbi:hypothetical protein [Deinococcus roseus]|uniref:Uncharacterized protein n=1 Tax=Deinococcus roseus TaxID=392414 RepID=A0ABQ2DD33_9DEIO|nr:hypothetical protein [Deinococcus roseus]GGJ51781.1 hypothetical protein GCM10008938_42280 [Deinococcus roseus]